MSGLLYQEVARAFVRFDDDGVRTPLRGMFRWHTLEFVGTRSSTLVLHFRRNRKVVLVDIEVRQFKFQEEALEKLLKWIDRAMANRAMPLNPTETFKCSRVYVLGNSLLLSLVPALAVHAHYFSPNDGVRLYELVLAFVVLALLRKTLPALLTTYGSKGIKLPVRGLFEWHLLKRIEDGPQGPVFHFRRNGKAVRVEVDSRQFANPRQALNALRQWASAAVMDT
jgi:hypothetical protein